MFLELAFSNIRPYRIHKNDTRSTKRIDSIAIFAFPNDTRSTKRIDSIAIFAFPKIQMTSSI